jgi:NAD(P)-dependent dehydrogenase (short-subunit alcohol dehydrogenase family)
MKRVVVVGGTGTIGSAVVAELERGFEVVVVGNTSGDLRVDISSKNSIRDLFEQVGEFDALVSAAGRAAFGPLDELDDDDFDLSLSNKLMGQVNLVRLGHEYVAPGGSFTLTSGILARKPMNGSAAISLVNAGIEGFVRAAALELDGTARVNVVSPEWVSETLDAMGRDPDDGIPAADVARVFRDAITGTMTGTVLDAVRA